MNERAEIDRRNFIGGSDIAAILGISPWRSPVELWQRKTRDDNEPKRVGSAKKALFERGKRWESVVAEMLVERLEEDGHEVEIVARNQRYVDPNIEYLACEIDYELKLDGSDNITNCELKTVHPFAAKEWGEADMDDAVPIWYAAQAMFGLGITDRNKCIVAPLFGADEIRTYTIERDIETIDAMRAKAYTFWQDHVLTGVPPAPIVLRDMDILHPLGGDAPALIADDELTESLLRMRAVDREIKAREGERDLLEFEIKKAMGDCTSIVIGGGSGKRTKEAASWKARKNSHLDQSRLKEEHPTLVKLYTKKGESRVFTLKGYSLDGVMP